MTLIGELSTWVALLMAAWTVTVSFASGALSRVDLAQSGGRALYATFGFSAIAAVGMWSALLGSTMLWCVLLTGLASAALAFDRGTRRRVMPWMTGIFGLVALALLLAICFGADPYVRVPAVESTTTASNASGGLSLAIGTFLALAGMTLVLGPLLNETAPPPPRHGHRMTDHATDPIEAAIQRAREAQKVCGTCGPRSEPDAVYCSNCGGYLPEKCEACGTHVDTKASSYCAQCGHQLAAV